MSGKPFLKIISLTLLITFTFTSTVGYTDFASSVALKNSEVYHIRANPEAHTGFSNVRSELRKAGIEIPAKLEIPEDDFGKKSELRLPEQSTERALSNINFTINGEPYSYNQRIGTKKLSSIVLDILNIVSQKTGLHLKFDPWSHVRISGISINGSNIPVSTDWLVIRFDLKPALENVIVASTDQVQISIETRSESRSELRARAFKGMSRGELIANTLLIGVFVGGIVGSLSVPILGTGYNIKSTASSVLIGVGTGLISAAITYYRMVRKAYQSAPVLSAREIRKNQIIHSIEEKVRNLNLSGLLPSEDFIDDEVANLRYRLMNEATTQAFVEKVTAILSEHQDFVLTVSSGKGRAEDEYWLSPHGSHFMIGTTDYPAEERMRKKWVWEEWPTLTPQPKTDQRSELRHASEDDQTPPQADADLTYLQKLRHGADPKDIQEPVEDDTPHITQARHSRLRDGEKPRSELRQSKQKAKKIEIIEVVEGIQDWMNLWDRMHFHLGNNKPGVKGYWYFLHAKIKESDDIQGVVVSQNENGVEIIDSYYGTRRFLKYQDLQFIWADSYPTWLITVKAENAKAETVSKLVQEFLDSNAGTPLSKLPLLHSRSEVRKVPSEPQLERPVDTERLHRAELPRAELRGAASVLPSHLAKSELRARSFSILKDMSRGERVLHSVVIGLFTGGIAGAVSVPILGIGYGIESTPLYILIGVGAGLIGAAITYVYTSFKYQSGVRNNAFKNSRSELRATLEEILTQLIPMVQKVKQKFPPVLVMINPSAPEFHQTEKDIRFIHSSLIQAQSIFEQLESDLAGFQRNMPNTYHRWKQLHGKAHEAFLLVDSLRYDKHRTRAEAPTSPTGKALSELIQAVKDFSDRSIALAKLKEILDPNQPDSILEELSRSEAKSTAELPRAELRGTASALPSHLAKSELRQKDVREVLGLILESVQLIQSSSQKLEETAATQSERDVAGDVVRAPIFNKIKTDIQVVLDAGLINLKTVQILNFQFQSFAAVLRDFSTRKKFNIVGTPTAQTLLSLAESFEQLIGIFERIEIGLYHSQGESVVGQAKAVVADLRLYDIEANRLDPKRLDGMVMPDGTEIHALRNLSDFMAAFPEAVDQIREHWDRHYAVFQIDNPILGYTAYVAIHRLTQIQSKGRVLNGQWRATGGTRILSYQSDVDALIDALELSQEMSFKNAGAGINGLKIGGSKSAIRSHKVNPAVQSPERDAILESYAKAVEKIGNLIGGGVLTGQDMNISVRDAELLFKFAPTSIVPYSDETGNSKVPTHPTGVGIIASLKGLLSEIFPDNPEIAGKVFTVQGVGGVGSEVIQPILDEGGVVIASDVSQGRIDKLFEDHPALKTYADQNRFFHFLEEPKTGGGYTTKIFNPAKHFKDDFNRLGVDHVDIFVPAARGPVINADAAKELMFAGVKGVVGSTNNVLYDKVKDAEELKAAGITPVPDYISNAGGVTGVDGHLGHDSSDSSIAALIQHRTRVILQSAKAEGITPQAFADRESRKFFESLPFAPLPTEIVDLESLVRQAAVIFNKGQLSHAEAALQLAFAQVRDENQKQALQSLFDLITKADQRVDSSARFDLLGVVGSTVPVTTHRSELRSAWSELNLPLKILTGAAAGWVGLIVVGTIIGLTLLAYWRLKPQATNQTSGSQVANDNDDEFDLMSAAVAGSSVTDQSSTRKFRLWIGNVLLSIFFRLFVREIKDQNSTPKSSSDDAHRSELRNSLVRLAISAGASAISGFVVYQLTKWLSHDPSKPMQVAIGVSFISTFLIYLFLSLFKKSAEADREAEKLLAELETQAGSAEKSELRASEYSDLVYAGSQYIAGGLFAGVISLVTLVIKRGFSAFANRTNTPFSSAASKEAKVTPQEYLRSHLISAFGRAHRNLDILPRIEIKLHPDPDEDIVNFKFDIANETLIIEISNFTLSAAIRAPAVIAKQIVALIPEDILNTIYLGPEDAEVVASRSELRNNLGGSVSIASDFFYIVSQYGFAALGAGLWAALWVVPIKLSKQRSDFKLGRKAVELSGPFHIAIKYVGRKQRVFLIEPYSYKIAISEKVEGQTYLIAELYRDGDQRVSNLLTLEWLINRINLTMPKQAEAGAVPSARVSKRGTFYFVTVAQTAEQSGQADSDTDGIQEPRSELRATEATPDQVNSAIDRLFADYVKSSGSNIDNQTVPAFIDTLEIKDVEREIQGGSGASEAIAVTGTQLMEGIRAFRSRQSGRSELREETETPKMSVRDRILDTVKRLGQEGRLQTTLTELAAEADVAYDTLVNYRKSDPAIEAVIQWAVTEGSLRNSKDQMETKPAPTRDRLRVALQSMVQGKIKHPTLKSLSGALGLKLPNLSTYQRTDSGIRDLISKIVVRRNVGPSAESQLAATSEKSGIRSELRASSAVVDDFATLGDMVDRNARTELGGFVYAAVENLRFPNYDDPTSTIRFFDYFAPSQSDQVLGTILTQDLVLAESERTEKGQELLWALRFIVPKVDRIAFVVDSTGEAAIRDVLQGISIDHVVFSRSYPDARRQLIEKGANKTRILASKREKAFFERLGERYKSLVEYVSREDVSALYRALGIRDIVEQLSIQLRSELRTLRSA